MQTAGKKPSILFAIGPEKYIWNISTMMTEQPVNSTPDNQDDLAMSQYRNQKLALEEATRQLRFKNSWPRISIIRPGGVATQPTWNNAGKADVNQWVKSIIDIFTQNDSLDISEISIGHVNKRIPL